jgi:hypothetical protein
MPKIPCGSPTISTLLSSTSIKTSWSKDKWIGTECIGVTISGYLSDQEEEAGIKLANVNRDLRHCFLVHLSTGLANFKIIIGHSCSNQGWNCQNFC